MAEMAENRPVSEVAESYGVHHQTVRNACDEWGVTTQGRKRYGYRNLNLCILKWLLDGRSRVQVARILGITVARVDRTIALARAVGFEV